MRFDVRSKDRVLTLPSFMDLQSLYRVGFLTDDDQVRRENSDRWLRLGDLPELRSMHLYDRSTQRRAFGSLVWLTLGLFAIAVTVQLFLSRSSRAPAPAGPEGAAAERSPNR